MTDRTITRTYVRRYRDNGQVTTMTYQPKRSSPHWLEGAPAPVLTCYDSGPDTADRYTVLYGAPFWDLGYGREIPYLAMSGAPFHPQGFCQHGQMPAHNRAALGKKIRFTDLPADCQHAVKQDCADT